MLYEKMIRPENTFLIEDLRRAGLMPLRSESEYVMVLSTRDPLMTGYSAVWNAGVAGVEWKNKSPHMLLELDDFKKSIFCKPITEFPIIAELAEIVGLVQIAMCSYKLVIQRAEAFEWEELVPQIIEAWKTYQLKKEFK